MKPLIEVNDLTKKYGDRYAIKNINFSISAGEVIGLLGPNGAGKSTTMKILSGLLSPTKGVAKICGYDVFENPIEVKKRIGYLPENPPLYLDMTILDYLKYVADLKKVETRFKVSNIEEALTKTNLLEVRNRLIKNLSKGFKQRVGIAQTLVSKPELLILDEPTVGLDPKQVIEIRELIQSLKGQHTVILSTHILSEVEATCDRVFIIHKGQLVAKDSLQNLQNSRLQKNQTVFIKIKEAFDFMSKFKILTSVLDVQTKDFMHYILKTNNAQMMFAGIFEILSQQNSFLMSYQVEESNLENIFLELTYNADQKGL